MANAEFRGLFAEAGCLGWLCVAEVDGDGEVAAGADEPVVAASVFKVAVALEVFTHVDAGQLDPANGSGSHRQTARRAQPGCRSSRTKLRSPSATSPC